MFALELHVAMLEMLLVEGNASLVIVRNASVVAMDSIVHVLVLDLLVVDSKLMVVADEALVLVLVLVPVPEMHGSLSSSSSASSSLKNLEYCWTCCFFDGHFLSSGFHKNRHPIYCKISAIALHNNTFSLSSSCSYV